jgi:hypothetical protein
VQVHRASFPRCGITSILGLSGGAPHRLDDPSGLAVRLRSAGLPLSCLAVARTANVTRPRQMARPGHAHTSPVRTLQAATAAREERLSLRRMLAGAGGPCARSRKAAGSARPGPPGSADDNRPPPRTHPQPLHHRGGTPDVGEHEHTVSVRVATGSSPSSRLTLNAPPGRQRPTVSGASKIPHTRNHRSQTPTCQRKAVRSTLPAGWMTADRTRTLSSMLNSWWVAISSGGESNDVRAVSYLGTCAGA